MTYTKCSICHNFGWTKSHKCPPLWYCRLDDWPIEDAKKIYADSAQKAAEIFCQQDDADCGDFIHLRDVLVSDDHIKEQKFEVSLDLLPSYNATLIN